MDRSLTPVILGIRTSRHGYTRAVARTLDGSADGPDPRRYHRPDRRPEGPTPNHRPIRRTSTGRRRSVRLRDHGGRGHRGAPPIRTRAGHALARRAPRGAPRDRGGTACRTVETSVPKTWTDADPGGLPDRRGGGPTRCPTRDRQPEGFSH